MCVEEEDKCIQDFGGKPEGMFWRPRNVWEESIKMDL